MMEKMIVCHRHVGNGQWWRALVTLTIIYAAVIIHTVVKWFNGQIHLTGVADWLRYIASALVNWPDVQQYWALWRVEWKLYKTPASSAYLVPQWHQWSVNVARLKYITYTDLPLRELVVLHVWAVPVTVSRL